MGWVGDTVDKIGPHLYADADAEAARLAARLFEPAYAVALPAMRWKAKRVEVMHVRDRRLVPPPPCPATDGDPPTLAGQP